MRTLVPCILLAACTHGTSELPADALGTSPVANELVVSQIVAGEQVRLTMSRSTPGIAVHFLGSRRGYASCTLVAGVCIDLERPFYLGSAITDADGIASLTVTAPPRLQEGVPLYFQASSADPGQFVITPVVEAYTGLGVCLAVWAPVCGVDGMTYGNDCEAGLAGWPIDYDGPC